MVEDDPGFLVFVGSAAMISATRGLTTAPTGICTKNFLFSREIGFTSETVSVQLDWADTVDTAMRNNAPGNMRNKAGT
ncbi:hypothetical protein CV014_28700 [Nostoc sp. CMAA1605]|nr:hypothetical protein [Nostoc sp. CMAA1605]